MENFYELLKEVRERKIFGNMSQKEIQKELYRIGEMGLKENSLEGLIAALDVYKELGNEKKVRIVGERCIEKKWGHGVNKAFKFINDKKGLFRAIQIGDEKGELELRGDYLSDFLGTETIEKTFDNFREWASKKGIDPFYSLDLPSTLNMTYHLHNNYDVGIGIAKGGLFSSYLFNLFGLPIKVAQCHNQERETSFNWMDEVDNDSFEGKRIAVFDKDVVTGRTSKRTLDEVQKYDPKTVDLVLNNNPIRDLMGIGTVESEIPNGYNQVYYPKKFNYQHFDKTAVILEQKLNEEIKD